MRDRLGKLTLDDFNRAIRAHLSAKDLSAVVVTKDAKGSGTSSSPTRSRPSSTTRRSPRTCSRRTK
jgi:hypothetical protein